MSAAAAGVEFVRWREEFVSQERGSRVVHFYLLDAAGRSHLAVVGTERSLRHMVYVVDDDFRTAQVGGTGESGGAAAADLGFFSRKWRSRREVVDWLAAFLPSPRASVPENKVDLNDFTDAEGYLLPNMRKTWNSDITWSGSFWTCGKQLRHYQAFCRNATTISIHSFVSVLSEEEVGYLAYLEDMYEDKKGQKKVKVRWFHQNQEFACAIPPPAPHPNEVFITPCSQVISVECVDGIATVLTPEHYEKCLRLLPCSIPGLRLCFRQYSKNKFKRFDLRTLRGYFNQPALRSLSSVAETEMDSADIAKIINKRKIRFSEDHEHPYPTCLGTKICRGPLTNFVSSYLKLDKNNHPTKRRLSVKFIGPRNRLSPPFDLGEKVELLCQDSGIRGCWFKCTVVKSSHKKVKVQYDDVQDVDSSACLEEWVPAFKLAAPDKLGLRCSGRFTIRPCRPYNVLLDGTALLPGTAVDVWWNDGWWEGVVPSPSLYGDDNFQVYFPGEDIVMTCQSKIVRISKDWVNNQWVDIEPRPDLLSRIPSSSDQTQQQQQQQPQQQLDHSPQVKGATESGSNSSSSESSDQVMAGTGSDYSEEENKLVGVAAAAFLDMRSSSSNNGDHHNGNIEVGVDA